MTTHHEGFNGGHPPPPVGDRLTRVESKVDTLIDDVRELRGEVASTVGVVARLDAMAERWNEDRAEIKAALTAEQAAKTEANAVRLEHAKEALAKAEEGGKWLRRLLADKGLAALIAVFGSMVVMLLGVIAFLLTHPGFMH